MAKQRRVYTYPQAQAELLRWITKQRLSQADFRRWLETNGIIISQATCHALWTGKITPGPCFKLVFKQITGIDLMDGLIER